MKKNIAILGGGTGLSTLLKGIKYIDNINISAIVTVADSGGSTGLLRKSFNIPAVGDLRRVIASLSRNREELEESMEYRFKGTNTNLDGHTVGNLILTSQIMLKKNFSEGIEAATKMLNVSGKIIPVSNEYHNLNAEMEDGEIIIGEDNIGHSFNKRIKRVFYENVKASSHAINAVLNADYIFFGIGSLFTSLLANLVYPEIKEALKKTNAKIIYFSNIFSQHGETDNFSFEDHIHAIENHTHKNIIDKIIFSNTRISPELIAAYKNDNQELLNINEKFNVIKYDLASKIKNLQTGKIDIRHDEVKIEKAVRDLIGEK